MCNELPDAEAAQSCNGNAALFYLGTSTLGCDAYLQSQKGACKCPKKKKLQIEQQTEL